MTTSAKARAYVPTTDAIATDRPFRHCCLKLAWSRKREPAPDRCWNPREFVCGPGLSPGRQYSWSIPGAPALRQLRFPARRRALLYEFLLRRTSECGLPRPRLRFLRSLACVLFLSLAGGVDLRCRKAVAGHPGWPYAPLREPAEWMPCDRGTLREGTCA